MRAADQREATGHARSCGELGNGTADAKGGGVVLRPSRPQAQAGARAWGGVPGQAVVAMAHQGEAGRWRA